MSLQLVKLVDPINVFNADMTFQGPFDEATDYTIGDVVSYEGSSYVLYAEAAAGVLPTDETKWTIFAEKGADGSGGATGSEFFTDEFKVKDRDDDTKQFQFDAAGASPDAITTIVSNASASHTITLPDDSATLATTDQLLDKMQNVTPGTDGNVLTSNGTDWVSEAPAGGGGGSGIIYSSYSLALFQSTNELSKSVSGSYNANTFGSNGMGTYMDVAGGASVRQEIVRNFYNATSMSRVRSFYAFTYIYGDVNTGLSHKTYVGIGPVGNGSAGQNINEDASNIGFIIDTALDGYLKIYAVNGNGTSSTKTQIYSRDVVTLDGGGPSISPILTFSNTGSEITFYIDGTLGATHTTNIPTADVSKTWTWLSQKPAGLASKWLSVDIFETSYTLG